MRFPLLIPLAALSVAVCGIGAWTVTGASSLLALGLVSGLCSAVLAIGVAWRLAEQVRRQRESMQKGERMRLLGQVSGGLAHQLRNAVAGTKLAVQLHSRSCVDGESLDVARRQLARVEADVARFLDLGRDDTPRRPCRIVELVDEAVALLLPQSRHADVQLCWEPPLTDPIVTGDPGRLGHVIINLLTNAIDAAGAGGQVEATVERNGDGSCAIEVWDSGPGPDPIIAGRLFQPFVTGKADGVGLGLFVARQAAEAHGGRLDWRREGQRTCFRVELSDVDVETADEPAGAI
jgi:signal transduction histidine kinase